MSAPGQVASAAQGEAAAVAGTAKDEAGNVASTAVGAAGDVAGTAKQEAGNVLGETVDQVKDLTGQVKEQAAQQVSTQSEKLTGTLRDLSKQMSEGDTSGVIGQVLGEVGTRVQGLADHLERVGPQGLLTDLRGYARRNPGPFLLGMAVAGFATGRIAKGMTAGKEQEQLALPAAPTAYAPGAGPGSLTQPATAGGYTPSPYPETTYPPLDQPAVPASDYFDSPLPADTQTRGAR